MNLAETFAMLRRQWNIWLPGIVVALIFGLCAWMTSSPSYTRDTVDMLVPSRGAWAPGTDNPLVNLSGLTQTRDALVRALNDDEDVSEIASRYPGVQVQIEKQWDVTGPMVWYEVVAPSDRIAAIVMDRLTVEAAEVFDSMQDHSSVAEDKRIRLVQITGTQTDGQVDHKAQLTVSASVAGGVFLFLLAVAAIVDGLVRSPVARGRRSQRRRAAAVRRVEMGGGS